MDLSMIVSAGLYSYMAHLNSSVTILIFGFYFLLWFFFRKNLAAAVALPCKKYNYEKSIHCLGSICEFFI
jgi:hypothetical protein